MAYSTAVKKHAGWELLLNESNDPKEASTSTEILDEVRDLYPPNKIKMYEVLSLADDYTVTGGSTSGLAQARANMQTDLLPLGEV